MNVFEDLLTDLKQDNLLEDTVLEEHRASAAVEPARSEERRFEAAPSSNEIDEPERTQDDPATNVPVVRAAANGREFFKKRAVAEVSSLQMVEHVLTGVEREYMKVKPQPFDDLKTKLALNKFLKIADDAAESDDHKASELDLMRETEAWCTALSDRDTKIYVSSLRQYCENTRPALSSQALVALCRFYRNLPYSESTRAKYDFLLTRLFTRAVEDDTRVCLFRREEAQNHLENLYKDWSSVPLYAADEDDSKLMLTALSFDDLAQESENASSFDQLIESDFFSRLRMFKESIAELFFAPQVAISAIEANVRIGNSYVKLIAAERRKMDADSIQQKYGNLDDDSVSEATARTLQLVELLKSPSFDEIEYAPPPVREQLQEVIDFDLGERTEKKPVTEKARGNEFLSRLKTNAFAVNKWLLISAIVLVSASVGLYVWANYVVDETASSAGVSTVPPTNAVVHEHLKTAKVSNDILYGLLDQSWEVLPKEKRVDYVQRLLAQGPDLGYTQVNLMTREGKQAAYGSRDKLEVQMP
jgi:hypothetical protein